MSDKWISAGLYEHPAKHQKGVFGNVGQSPAGIYFLRVGGSHMSCPQDWAAKIHAEETGQAVAVMSVRDVPESLRMAFRGRALQEGKTMQAKIIELMQEYVNGGDK
jgi:hypothetical protein